MSATTDADKIDEWWTKWPDANIGVATGMVSGILVLDIDPRNGGRESITQKILTHGRQEPTIVAITGHPDGRHVYWRHPGKVKIQSGANLAPGLDLKADGGYVVAPPSRHTKGRRYAWHSKGHPNRVRLQPAPDWIFSDLLANVNEAKQIVKQPVKHGNGNLNPDEVPMLDAGSRNDGLARIAGRLVWEGHDSQTVIDRLMYINGRKCSPPLPDREVRRIADGIAKRYSGRPKRT